LCLDVNKRDENGNSLLYLAAACGNVSSVQFLLLSGADVNATNSQGMSPLYVAVMNGHEQVIDVLLSKKYNCDVNISDRKYGQTPLHIAALVRHSLDNFFNDFIRKDSTTSACF
jgi:ankyrin repeat protein